MPESEAPRSFLTLHDTNSLNPPDSTLIPIRELIHHLVLRGSVHVWEGVDRRGSEAGLAGRVTRLAVTSGVLLRVSDLKHGAAWAIDVSIVNRTGTVPEETNAHMPVPFVPSSGGLPLARYNSTYPHNGVNPIRLGRFA